MSSAQLLVCPICKRKDFKAQYGLEQHRKYSKRCAPSAPTLGFNVPKFASINKATEDSLNGTFDKMGVVLREIEEAFDEDSCARAQLLAANNPSDQVQVDSYDGAPPPAEVDVGYDMLSDMDYNSMQLQDDTDDELLLTDNEDQDEEEDVRNYGPLDEFASFCEFSKQHRMPLTKDQVNAINLLHKLLMKKACLDTYEEVMEWHFKACGVLKDHQGLGDAKGYINRKKLFQYLAERYYNNPDFYESTSTVLPSTKAKVNVIWHHANLAVMSLLTDPRISDDDYLFFDDNPLAPPPDNLNYVADSNTGLSYTETYKRLITNPEKQMLVPLILYIDGAVSGQFDKLEVTALKMSLGIHKREVRDKDHAWRVLGFIPNYTKESSRSKKLFANSGHVAASRIYNDLDDGEGGDQKDDIAELVDLEEGGDTDEETGGTPDEEKNVHEAQDFHHILSICMRSVTYLTDKGMVWTFRYRGEVYKEVELIFFIQYIKCDTQEADKLCGKFLARGRNVAQLCRVCCCPNAESSNPMAKYPFKTVDLIKQLQGDVEALRALSQQPIQNAFYKHRLGLHNNRGIHGACPLELLHALLLGIFMEIRNCFFAQIGRSSQAASDINALAKLYGVLFTRQSDRDLPKTNFAKGIQKGKIMAKEFSGVLLLMAVLLQSSEGRRLLRQKRSHFGEDHQLDDWALLVERLLEWEAFLKQDQMQRKHVKRLEKKHRYLMYLILKIGNRQKGMGWNTYKFHAIQHIAMEILMFGVPMCVDTGSNESHHKRTKIAAKLTQRDLRFFDGQTATRLQEFYLLELAKEEIDGRALWDYFDGYDNEIPVQMDLEPPPPPEPKTYGTRMKVFLDEETNAIGWRFWKTRMKNPDDVYWDTDVQKYIFELQEALYPQVKYLDIKTEHKRFGQIFRGHPQYRQMGQWNDWVMIDWTGYGRLPAEIWCYVDLRNAPEDADLVFDGQTLDRAVYAVIESATYIMEDNANQLGIQASELGKSDLFIPLVKDVEMVDDDEAQFSYVRTFHLADVSAFVEPIIVIPDVGADVKRKYFQVMPRKDWSIIFERWVNRPHTEDVHYD